MAPNGASRQPATAIAVIAGSCRFSEPFLETASPVPALSITLSRRTGAVATARSSIVDLLWTRYSTAKSRFAAVRYALQIERRVSGTVTETEPVFAREHHRRSPWLPAERELGIRTTKRRPGSSQIECGGENADRGDDGASELRIAVCYGLRGFANRERGSCLTPPDPSWCQSSSSLRSSCAAVFGATEAPRKPPT